jgi:hypothetical protein
MTTKKKPSRASATKSTTKTRRTKAVQADCAPIAEPMQREPGLAETTETPPALIPEVAASNLPTVNETEAPARTQASVETATTTPTANSPGESVSPANKRSALDAAAKVLDETGQAMSCAELIATMAAKGYWSSPKGRTPAGTLYSAILRELQTKGDKARFCKSQRGKFRLNRALP